MKTGVALWEFRGSVEGVRAARLSSYPTFDAVASLLAAPVVCGFLWERFSGAQISGCHRASFLIEVSSLAYDAFFNSPVGYRGQYARSLEAGEEANRKLIAQFEPQLLAYASVHSSVSQESVAQSLRAAQAKVWIFEAEVESQLGETEPAIAYAPWEHSSESGVGLLAPMGTRIEVKGGWLAADGSERINPVKVRRSDEIRLSGYS
jgi:hypothetical protein